MTQSIEDLVRSYFDSPSDEQFQQSLKRSIEAHAVSASAKRIPIGELASEFSSTAIPQVPLSKEEYLELCETKILPNAVNVGHRHFVGHMTSALPDFLPPLSALTTYLNQNVVKVETSHAFTLIERQVLAMMHREVFRLGAEFYDSAVQDRNKHLGVITSGGSLANLTAMWIARESALNSLGDASDNDKNDRRSSPKTSPKNVKSADQGRRLGLALGRHGFRGAAIIGSQLMHYSFDKLGSLLALGADGIIKIRQGADSPCDLEEMEATIQQCRRDKILVVAVVGIAGTTETGSIDDLSGIAALAERNGVWFHVDAAWGGPTLFSEQYGHLLDGIDQADSVTICGHKQLYLPQGCSMVLTRAPDSVRHIRALARYQARADSYDLGKHSAEGSRPATSFYLHAGLNMLGRAGYGFLIDDGIRRAKSFAREVDEHPAFELIEHPTLNIVVYRFIPPEHRHDLAASIGDSAILDTINSFNEVLQDQIYQRRSLFVSRTSLYLGDRRHVVLRAVFSNPLTKDEDLIAVLNDQVALAADIAGESYPQVDPVLY